MSVSVEVRASGARRWVEVYCVIAGLMDSVTGVLLIVSPVFTLRSMGISSAPAEPVFLRWIGVFVGAVGLAYLYPFVLRSDLGERRQRLRTVLEVTALERLAVGSFVTAALMTSALPLPWGSVALTDLGLAALQWLILRQGWWK